MPITWETKKVRIQSADVQWDGTEDTLSTIKNFVPEDRLEVTYREDGLIDIRLWNTLEKQWLNTPHGHWVVLSLKGEFYPCDPEAMDGKYFEVGEETEQVSLFDLINELRSIGFVLAGDEYIKASEEIEMGESLIRLADNLAKFGVK